MSLKEGRIPRYGPLPESGPLPPYSNVTALIYYHLICGDTNNALLLARFYPRGVLAHKSVTREHWKSPAAQALLRRTIEEMAKKQKIRIKRPELLPEAQIETVEDLIATAEEVLIYLTACMRGQLQEEVLMNRLSGAGEQVIERLKKQVGPKDRTKAAELLARRYGLLDHKLLVEIKEPVVFRNESELED